MTQPARSLAFLYEQAITPDRQLSKGEQSALTTANLYFRRCDALVVLLGGKAGRLGETIVATALLEGILEALRIFGRHDVPITIGVDAGAFELFDDHLYQERWGQRITFFPIAADQRAEPPKHFAAGIADENVFIIDLHGEHDGEPQIDLAVEPIPTRDGQTDAEPDTYYAVVTLANLARLCIRSYAVRGPVRRYADAVEELFGGDYGGERPPIQISFGLPKGSISGEIAQPRILLAPETPADIARIALLTGIHNIAPTDILITCFFQSVVAAKVYEQWDTVMLAICSWAQQHLPGRRLRFVIPCGDDDLHPNGPTLAVLASAFADFTGVEGNADVTPTRIPSLRDLALVTQQATLTLSNDTGPGHLSGALGIPTVTPYLPGAVYSQQVWASTLAHHGVTVQESAITNREVEAAVLWNRTDVINAIPPERLAEAAIGCLAARFLE